MSSASNVIDPVVAANLRRNAVTYAKLNEESKLNFKYDEDLPRGRIRVLNLHAGSHDEPIVCSLNLRPLKEGVESFDAVSYVWGDESEPQKISCSWRIALLQDDGSLLYSCDTEVRDNLSVTKSLYQLLRSIRHPQYQRRLWVDQICINQSNAEEKGVHIKSMSEVYSVAACVFVYLGKEDQETDSAFKMMIWLANTSHLSDSRARALAALMLGTSRSGLTGGDQSRLYDQEITRLQQEFETSIEPGIRRDLVDETVTDQAVILGMRAFRNLLVKRPWYHRTWTFQEAALACNAAVICGSWNHEWDTLYRACNSTIARLSLLGDSDQNPEYRRVLKSIADREALRSDYVKIMRLNRKSISDMVTSTLRNNQQDIEELAWSANGGIERYMEKHRIKAMLPALRNTNCKDPRDKVLGLLGISHDDGRWIVFPTYDMPVRNLYLCVVKYWMEEKIWGVPQLPGVGPDKTWAPEDESSWIDLSFLSHVQGSNPEHNLPSWVPDWSCPVTATPLISLSELSSLFKACGHTKARAAMDVIDFLDDITITPRLTVSGLRVLRIAAIAVKGSNDSSEATMLSAFSEPYPTTRLKYMDVFHRISPAFKISDCFISMEHHTIGFWEYIEQRQLQHSPQISSHTVPAIVSTSQQALHAPGIYVSLPTRQSEASVSANPVSTLNEEFENLVMSEHPAVAESRQPREAENDPEEGGPFFVTEEGFIGLGPPRMKVGDEIWVFEGMGVLAVLRKRASNLVEDSVIMRDAGDQRPKIKKERIFVGEALVLGLMSGEAMVGCEERIEEVVLV